MATFMLNLKDTAGRRMDLPIAVNPDDERVSVNLSSDKEDGAYLSPDAPKKDGIFSWDYDSWQMAGE